MRYSVLAMLDSLFGLPGHPLIVHGAVVLVPLAALGTIVMALWPAARNRMGWIVAGVGVVGFFFTYFAKESGEALLETVKVTDAVDAHVQMGTQGVIGAFLVGGSACAVMLLDLFLKQWAKRGLPELSISRLLQTSFGVIAIVLCVTGSIMVINVGHSGAKATWENWADSPAGTSTYERD
ncbi:hypothetical protein MCETE7_00992 [Acidimicrobiia bacterium]